MSVIVAGLWELGWSAPITEAVLWEYPLRDFAVDGWRMMPVTGIDNRHVTEYKTIEEMLDVEATVVFVDEHANTELADFDHPDDALYVFGKANYSPFLTHRRDGDLAVRFDTGTTAGLVWPHQAMAIVLYDREVKRGRDGN